ncbi:MULTISPECIES: IclR family transcriptional regulator C-terminal domain-containing protein [unclassified Campylobacter]|uniref:IclR family transcriptional regulator n=1 Tax=unclassified Campylobacter TaxID=2593542 RepID=UPI001BD9D28C|nr:MULTISPECIES: IclR family transcriptional regulator C-terminal domain-containing protein [unclassified Campylobacter]MBZ7976134.1 helix-turn-helix domain-containing protein [Campylobacter sp. RM12637]MBZ7977559.1 helix-turn-helix domain-containing protein [Campylobacter sp. RM12654]MBZ7981298.1 helix-turn-helix domain-containing protein [Campylobacter sp. RM12640]MBZ7983426.1 helix-turn-helix domain-containing protein [Campylobacter sp. RM12647]MBZ7989512.1 helix-turn-helix domain-containin
MDTLHQPTLRVIKILETLKNCDEGLNITQISKECKISVGTLHPILKTLCELDYLSFDNKNYKLSFCLNPELEQRKSTKIIIYYMDELAKKIRLAVQLGILNGKKVIYLHKSEGNEKIILKTKAGDVANANATALGKALLFDKNLNELKSIFKKQILEQNTARTINNINDLYDNIQYCKNLGYSYEYGEYDDDFSCFAVPIYKNQQIFAAISVTILKFHINDEKKDLITTELLKYKKIIEEQLQ